MLPVCWSCLCEEVSHHRHNAVSHYGSSVPREQNESCDFSLGLNLKITPSLLLHFIGSVKSQVKVKVAQSCPTFYDPMDYTVHGILQARILEWVAFPFSRGSSQPRGQTLVFALQADSLPAESQGKPTNTRVGSLSLLQQIFPTQELNWVSCIAGGFFTN